MEMTRPGRNPFGPTLNPAMYVPVSQLEESAKSRDVAASHFSHVDIVDEALDCLFSGLLNDQSPSGLFNGLRVEETLEVGRRRLQKALVHLKQPPA